MNFLPAPGEGVAALASVARRGGTVAAYVWDYAEGMELMRVFSDAAVELAKLRAAILRRLPANADGRISLTARAWVFGGLPAESRMGYRQPRSREAGGRAQG